MTNLDPAANAAPTAPQEATHCQPGDVITFRGGRSGHVVRVVEGRFANSVCGEVVFWSKLAQRGTPGEVVWLAPPQTPLCRMCLRKVSTAKALTTMPEIVRRCSFGQPTVPTHVPGRWVAS